MLHSQQNFVRPVAQHLAGLTGLRAIAAISVVIHHFGKVLMPAWTRPYFNGGGYLVDVFFVLSGFLLGYAYTSPEGLSVSPPRFLADRIARLYPAYAVAMLLSLPHFLELLPHGSAGMKAAKIAVVTVATLTMVQSWLPRAQSWNDPAWSLSDEAFFYLLMALTASFLFRLSPVRRLFLCLAAVLTSAILLSTLAAPWIPRLPILRAAPFMLALIIGSWFRDAKLSRLSPITASVLQLLCLGLLLFSVAALPPDIGWGHSIASVVALCTILSLTQSSGAVSKTLDWQPMRILGDASYGIYIYQVGFFRSAELLTEPARLTLAGFLTTLTALVVFSVVSVRFYETPARRAIVRWLRRRYAERRRFGADSEIGPERPMSR